MKKISYFLFSLVFLTLSTVNTSAQVADGSATISVDCDGGKLAARNANGLLTCVQEVKFYSENNLSLDQAKAKAAENGWTLATVQELTDAFNMLNFSQFAYGTLADGQMAVPVQSDMSSFKKGVNIGVVGGNQGFFYTIKPGTPVVVPPTTPTTPTAPVTNNTITLSGDAGSPIPVKDYFNNEFFKLNGIPYDGSQTAKYDEYERRYENGIGNIMQDKWSDANYRPILEKALNDYIAEKFPNRYAASSIHLVDYLKNQIQNKDKNCVDCKIARYEYVGFFVPEYLKTLRTGSNPILSKQFSEYVSYQLAKANRYTLESWKYYSRSTTAELKDKPFIPGFHFNEDASLIDRDVIEPIVYDDTWRGRFIKSGIPLRDKTVAEFKSNYMNGSPMYFTHNQILKVNDYVVPLAAQSFPDDQGVKNVVGVPNYLSKNLSEEAKALNMAESIAVRAGTGLSIGAVTLFSGFALQAYQLAAEIARSLSGPITNLVVQNIGGQLVEKSVTTITSVGVNSAVLGSNGLGAAISNAIGPIGIGVGVFMVGFMPSGGKAIEIAIFENGLKDGCYINSRNENWMTMSDGEKIENFSFLFKMLIIDAKDFTHLVPAKVADLNEQRQIEAAAAVMASQNTAKYGALGNAVYGSLDARYNTATETPVAEITSVSPSGNVRIQNGWYKDHYIHNQNAVVEQGAIEPNWWSAQWTMIPAQNGWVKIQNKWKTDQYLHNQNGKLEVGPIQPNWQSALWKLEPAQNGWVRIQNSWYKNHYIHNQNGKLEQGPIQPNWQSALWKVEFGEVSGSGIVATPPVVTPPSAAQVNLALGKATKQSSDFGIHNSTFAVDGNTKDRHSGAMYTTTQDDTNPWWEVDLGANYDINQINVFNVTDHFKSRLQNLHIKVSTTPFTRNEDGQAFASNVFPDPVGNYKGNATGRYVRVYITRKDYLNICEVQVMGKISTATEPVVNTMAPAAPGYVRIQSVEKEGHYIHNQNGTLEVGPIQADWSSAQWKIITHAGDWVNIQSRSNPELYLNINGDKLEIAKVPPSYASCVWLKISMPSGSKNVRFLSNLHQSKYLLDQNGKIEVGQINTSSQSAIWKME